MNEDRSKQSKGRRMRSRETKRGQLVGVSPPKVVVPGYRTTLSSGRLDQMMRDRTAAIVERRTV